MLVQVCPSCIPAGDLGQGKQPQTDSEVPSCCGQKLVELMFRDAQRRIRHIVHQPDHDAVAVVGQCAS